MFPAIDFFDDGPGGSSPGERVGGRIVGLDVIANGLIGLENGMENASLQSLLGQCREESFDGVKPGRAGRREVDMEPGVVGQPLFHGDGLVRGVVVEDQVQLAVCRRFLIDGPQEPNELGGAVAEHALADDLALQNVQRGEQRGGAVALVIRGHGGGPVRLHRQTQLGPVKRLDLAILVDRQHQRVLGRVHVAPHDIAHFVGELEVVRELECRDLVGLELMHVPDALDRGMADAHMLAQAAHAPMRSSRRLLVQCRRNHAADHSIVELGLAPAARRVLEQAVEPRRHIASLPASDRWLALARRRPDRHRAVAFRRYQNNPRTPSVLLWAHAIGNDPFQPRPIPRRKPDLNAFPHASGFSQSGQQGNHQSVTIH